MTEHSALSIPTMPPLPALRTIAVETRFSPVPEVRSGLIVAGLFFVGLLGWAAVTPMDAAAIADGVVAVSGNRQAVQHRDGGIVTQINVIDGQMVKRGDVLLKVSASDTVAAERGLASEVIALMAQKARLTAERNGAGNFAEPAEFATLSATDRVLADDVLRGQRQLLAAGNSARQAEQAVLLERSNQYSQQISGLGTQLESNRKQQDLVGAELTGLQSLATNGYVSLNRVRATERSASQLQGEQGRLRADVARYSSAIAENRSQILSMRQTRLEEISTQLREVEGKLEELRPRWAAAKERMRLSDIRATASGQVVGLQVFTVGGVIAPGEKLMEIVPQDRALVIEANASPNDADDLKPGMETQVQFSALHDDNLPVLHGEISKVSADSFLDERTGQRHFKLEVRVPTTELQKIQVERGNSGIRPGLTATVMVPLRKRTALDYLVEPLRRAMWRSGREH